MVSLLHLEDGCYSAAPTLLFDAVKEVEDAFIELNLFLLYKSWGGGCIWPHDGSGEKSCLLQLESQHAVPGVEWPGLNAVYTFTSLLRICMFHCVYNFFLTTNLPTFFKYDAE